MDLGGGRRESQWRVEAQVHRPELPARFACWLFDRGSLTRRLQRACPGPFRVEVLAQSWQRPLREEALMLGLRPERWVLTRQVLLLCDGQPWVYARTVIPAATLVGRHRRLAHLGERPLGAVLFADPSMTRGAVEVAAVHPRQPLHRQIRRWVGGADETVWGRRSVFRLSGHPLLVYEMFLPSIGQCRD